MEAQALVPNRYSIKNPVFCHLIKQYTGFFIESKRGVVADYQIDRKYNSSYI